MLLRFLLKLGVLTFALMSVLAYSNNARADKQTAEYY
jgi:hypothetical protein